MPDWKNRIIEYQTVDIKSIVPNPDNPKEHPEYQKRVLAGLLEEVGIVQNIIVNRRTGHLVDGECRYFLALDHGESSLPATIIDVDAEEELKLLAALDEVSTLARRDDSKIQSIVDRIVVKNDGLRDLIDRIAHRAHYQPVKLNGDNGTDSNENDTESDSVDVDKNEKKDKEKKYYDDLVSRWEVERGKVWNIKSKSLPGGFHRLMCGDSQFTDDVQKLVSDKKASLMVTDPPYGIDFKLQKFNPRSKDWDGIDNDTISKENYRIWIKSLLERWLPAMLDDAGYYIWTAAMYESFMCLLGMEDAGVHVQSQIVWAKDNLVLGQTDYHWKHENCWYGFKLRENHRWYGGRYQTTLWTIAKVPVQSYLHPMQKPIDLYSIPIKNHTRTGDICFDPFTGSGTQYVACENLGRMCYGMEISERYTAVTLERISNDLGLEVEEE